MNRKGFTLIELLATIVLLAIIVSIAIPAVNSIVAKNKKNSCANVNSSVIKAAELYISDNKYDIIWNNYSGVKKYAVMYSDLYDIWDTTHQTNKYLNNVMVNPCDDTEYRQDFQIWFINDNGNIILESEDILPDEFTCCKD